MADRVFGWALKATDTTDTKGGSEHRRGGELDCLPGLAWGGAMASGTSALCWQWGACETSAPVVVCNGALSRRSMEAGRDEGGDDDPAANSRDYEKKIKQKWCNQRGGAPPSTCGSPVPDRARLRLTVYARPSPTKPDHTRTRLTEGNKNAKLPLVRWQLLFGSLL